MALVTLVLAGTCWSTAGSAIAETPPSSVPPSMSTTIPPATSSTTVVPGTAPATIPVTPAPGPGPAGAPDAPVVPGSTVTEAQVRAGIELGRLTDRLRSVTDALSTAQTAFDAAQHELDRVAQRITEVQAQAATLRQRIQERLQAVYRQSGTGALAALDLADRRDFGAGRVYADATNAVDQRLIERLDGMEADLDRERSRRADLLDGLERSRNSLALDRQRLEDLRGDQQTLLDQWGGLTVLGPTVLSGEQIADWFDSTGVQPRLPDGTSIRALADLFVEEGRTHGVRGDVAFAQSVIETGSFTEYSYDNFSGIGWCDSCTTGHRFDTPRDGVRAQVQLLRNYADLTGRADDIPVALSPALYGSDPVLAAQHYDTFFLKGKVLFWNQMGGGNWATDPYYAGKVLGIYARMLAFAAHRAG